MSSIRRSFLLLANDEFADPLMSALGQKQTFALQKVMSALPPMADICSAQAHVRFVPIADISRRDSNANKQTCPATGEARRLLSVHG
jgi:hypothetical protein